MSRWSPCGLVLVACSSGPPASQIDVHVQAFQHDAFLSFWADAHDRSSNYAVVTDLEIQVVFRAQMIPLLFSTAEPYSNAYHADVPAGAGDGEPVSFTVARDGTSSTVNGTTPAEFSITAPADPKVGNPIDLEWAPGSNDVMNWFVDSCNQPNPFNGQVPSDTGMFEFPAMLFGAGTSACDVQLSLVRERLTTPVSAFASIAVETDRQHDIEFATTM